MDSALALADRVGLEALTIRAIGKQVGAPPMSLYTHFANKRELLDLMYAEVARRLYADSGQPTWQAEVRALSEQVRRVLLEHPRWVPLLSRPTQPVRIDVRDRVLRLMADDGMTADVAFRSLSSAMLVSVGMALVELSFRDSQGQSAFSTRFDRIRAHFDETEGGPESQVAREAFAKLGRFDLGETFSFALRAVIAGFEAPLARAPKA